MGKGRRWKGTGRRWVGQGKLGLKRRTPEKNVACYSVYIFHPIVLFPISNNNCLEHWGRQRTYTLKIFFTVSVYALGAGKVRF